MPHRSYPCSDARDGMCGVGAARGASQLRPTHVSLVRMTKTYETKKRHLHALQEVNLEVERGEFVSIIGPSGCGKSTLLSLVAGLESPSTGQVLVEGRELKGAHSDVGVVFQTDLLLERRTAIRNVLLQFELRGIDPKPHTGKAQKLLDQVGLGNFADVYPSQLSGGMRQRVAICRALAPDPLLLLMAEPFGAVDAMTREQLNIDLSRLTQDQRITVLLVTHSIEEAVFLADRVVVMTPQPGRIAAIVPVPVPKPRTVWPRGMSAFSPITEKVRAILESSRSQ